VDSGGSRSGLSCWGRPHNLRGDDLGVRKFGPVHGDGWSRPWGLLELVGVVAECKERSVLYLFLMLVLMLLKLLFVAVVMSCKLKVNEVGEGV
jgi:hypothetical protein